LPGPRRLDRQGELKGRAAFGVARGAKLSTVRVHDRAGDGEAHAKSLGLGRVAARHALDVCHVKPLPVSIATLTSAPPSTSGPEAVRLRRTHGLHPVEDQIQDHLLELLSIPAHARQTRGQIQRHRHVPEDHIAFHELGHFTDQIVEVEQRVIELALLEQSPQSGDHGGGPLVVGNDLVEQLAQLVEVRPGSLEELLSRTRC
jgi:hypothetical protein